MPPARPEPVEGRGADVTGDRSWFDRLTMSGGRGGFTLIELLVVISLMGLLLTLALPRLSAFLTAPEDRELRNLEHFVFRAARIAVREPLVPIHQPDAKPLRLKLIPPQRIVLLRADTELASFELTLFRMDEIDQDGLIALAAEPEFVFNPLGLVPPFSMKLLGAKAKDRFQWGIDRTGGIRVGPVL